MLRLVTVASVLSSNTGASPAAVIDTTDDAAKNYWASRLNVPQGDLVAAIEKVGPSIAAVRRHLGK